MESVPGENADSKASLGATNRTDTTALKGRLMRRGATRLASQLLFIDPAEGTVEMTAPAGD